jgi:hypothetical protein
MISFTLHDLNVTDLYKLTELSEEEQRLTVGGGSDDPDFSDVITGSSSTANEWCQWGDVWLSPGSTIMLDDAVGRWPNTVAGCGGGNGWQPLPTVEL